MLSASYGSEFPPENELVSEIHDDLFLDDGAGVFEDTQHRAIIEHVVLPALRVSDHLLHRMLSLRVPDGFVELGLRQLRQALAFAARDRQAASGRTSLFSS